MKFNTGIGVLMCVALWAKSLCQSDSRIRQKDNAWSAMYSAKGIVMYMSLAKPINV